jgi:uncharacterized 2Fe-2S/4Fe-4S cluster protein (DUF4445 family)
MKINLQNSSAICNAAAGETILHVLARAGIILSAPCASRQRCGKCKVQILEGKVSGDTPDNDGWVRACLATALTDIVITAPTIMELTGSEEALYPLPETHRPSHVGLHHAGIALDVGTTTVSARLIDLDTLNVLDTISELNDQRVFGADVMSRIGAAKDGKTKELFSLINHQTEKFITSLKKRWNISKIEKRSFSSPRLITCRN